MSVYQPLGDYLARLSTDHVNLTFTDVEQIIHRRLPPSARTRSVWWANDHSSPGRCCAAWLDVGWKVDSINLSREMVSFARERLAGRRSAPPVPITKPVAVPNVMAASTTSNVGFDRSNEWYWEGNVQRGLVAHLLSEGWSIRSYADSAGHEHGIDVVAAKDGRLLAVEVKGYPPSIYTAGVRKGEVKPGPKAREQAEKFFAQALLTAIKTKRRLPKAQVALAFPLTDHYDDLTREVKWALERLGIGVYLK